VRSTFAQRPLLALNRPQKPQHIRPLSSQKWTHAKFAYASAFDPKEDMPPQNLALLQNGISFVCLSQISLLM
jgi:hypothetical protein